MIDKAKEIAKSLGNEYLRLFVVDINIPAIKLYIKNGFEKADFNNITNKRFINFFITKTL